MKISCCFLYAISKYGYPPTIADVLRALKEMKAMGFEYVELEGVRKHNLTEIYRNRTLLRQTCDDLGLKIVNFCPILPGSVAIDSVERERSMDLFKLALEIADEFGCEMVQIDSFPPPLTFHGEVPYHQAIKYGQQYKVTIPDNFQWERVWEALVDGILRMNQMAKSAGLPLCLEPRVGEMISNTDSILRLMDALNDENFGAVFDTGHLHAQKEILLLSIEKLARKIFYVHVSDNNGLTNDHLPLGKGTIDWGGIFASLKRHQFKGYVAVDVGNVPDLEKAYIDSRKYLERIATELDM